MVLRWIYTGRGNRDNVNGVNANFKFLFDDIQSIKMALMDVVAKDMLTAEQYAEFIEIMNGLIKKGEISISDINTNLGKIGLAHLSDEVIQAIAGTANVNAVPADGSIVTQKLAPLAVTPEKTTFFEVGKNKFNFKNVIVDKYVSETTGTLTDLAGFVTSQPKKVSVGQDITINKVRKVAYFDINMKFVSGVSLTQGLYTGKAPQNGYVQFSVDARNTSYTDVQLEFNSTFTGFEPYSIKLVEDISVTPLISNVTTNYVVTKNGNNIDLTTYLDNKKLEIKTVKNGSQNGSFNFNGDYLDGTLIHSTTDDITPIRSASGTVGANHGYTSVIDLANTDKTMADLGSQWSDGTTTYVLLRLVNGRLIFGCPYSETKGYVEAVKVNPVANLTHVSGATNTSSISISTINNLAQLYPSTSRINVTYKVDGELISEDKTYKGNTVVVSEQYDILDYKAIVDYAKANIGKDYATAKDSIRGCLIMSNTFTFYDRGKCTTSHSIRVTQPTYLGRSGTLQSVALTHPTYKVMRYVPNVSTVNGIDFTKPIDLSTYNNSVLVTKANLTDSTKAVNRYVDYLVNGSTTELAFTMGYIHDKTDSKDSSRLSNVTNLWDFRDSKKSYPIVIENKLLAVGDYYSFEGYRNYFIPKNKALIENYVSDAESTYFIVDELLPSSFSSADFKGFIGKTVVPTESKGVEIKNNVIDSLGLSYKVTESNAYFIAKSNK